MLKENVSQIGTDFKMEDMLIDLVEPCYGFSIVDNDGFLHQYEIGNKYRDADIINCFVHHESSSLFMAVKFNDMYFMVDFDNIIKYEILKDDLPFR